MITMRTSEEGQRAEATKRVGSEPHSTDVNGLESSCVWECERAVTLSAHVCELLPIPAAVYMRLTNAYTRNNLLKG